jgi:hypothetical protein
MDARAQQIEDIGRRQEARVQEMFNALEGPWFRRLGRWLRDFLPPSPDAPAWRPHTGRIPRGYTPVMVPKGRGWGAKRQADVGDLELALLLTREIPKP